jgi:hypothetical protein
MGSKTVNFLSLRRWIFAALLFTALIAAAFLMIILPRSAKNLPFSNDPRFFATAPPTIVHPPNATLAQWIFNSWFDFNQRFRKPNPSAYTFSAHGTNICSISGLLNQCMEVTGIRYVIAKDVASGSVQFGSPTPLNGTQWVLAFTDALQNGKPQWWDSQTKSFRTENLLLITNDAKTVLVLPKAMVQEFQKRTAN